MPPRPVHPRHALIRNLRAAPTQQTQQSRRQMGVYDANGNLRAGFGSLGAFNSARSGEYGVLVADPEGNVQVLYPPIPLSYAGGYTLLTSATNISAFGSVNAYVGATGNALVTISSVLAYGLSATGTLGPTINGGQYSYLIQNTFTTVGEQTVSNAAVYTGLPPNAIATFGVWGMSDTASYISLGVSTLTVQPI